METLTDSPTEQPRNDNTERLEALGVYHRALHDPRLHDGDETVRAAALVAVDDAREAYRREGGQPGSRWQAKFAGGFLDARELLGEDVTERRAMLAEQLAALDTEDE
jgi:hypothetical protein